ncbi:Acid phosphatase type 7 [Amphibalanus amphitrite]|uniref:Acid phosphatase type 7 n=1 Tax=Amphibalanus amphitrite TaxID=1232801 RepID=A0A6A4VMV1_AMPAM|nr:Acid phosphatase type 7 [Amphibalanus amphitrite]
MPPSTLLLLVAVLAKGCSAADSSGAEQIHLSFTDDVTTIQVTYSTFQPVKASARYGTDQPDTLNGVALPFIVNDTYNEMYDAVLHVGDFGYDMFNEEGEVGDTFMRQLQPVAAHLPYMTCPGNHEYHANFSNYKNRFSMPGGTEGTYYSFDMGPVHFISISTEFYYFLEYGFEQVFSQYNWLVSDLEAATDPSARAARPWIVLYGHRPMYCTNRDMDDCTRVHDRVRVGAPNHDPPIPGLEDLLMQYGVDLAVWGHEHSYERMWPLYNYRI